MQSQGNFQIMNINQDKALSTYCNIIDYKNREKLLFNLIWIKSA